MECVVACHDKSQMKNHLAFQALRTMSVAIFLALMKIFQWLPIWSYLRAARDNSK